MWIVTSDLVFTDVDQLVHGEESWSAGVTGAWLHQADVLLVNQPFVTMETENRDTDGDENIVYLWNEQAIFGCCWNKTFGLGFAIWDLDQDLILLRFVFFYSSFNLSKLLAFCDILQTS